MPSVPQIPSEVDSFINQMIGYISLGFGLIAAFSYWPVVKALVVISLALFVFYHGYQLVMFILRKIPLLGID